MNFEQDVRDGRWDELSSGKLEVFGQMRKQGGKNGFRNRFVQQSRIYLKAFLKWLKLWRDWL